MKKYFILFFLPLIFCRCEDKELLFINEFTFDIDGVHYDLSRIDEIKITSEFGVIGYKDSEKSPVSSLFYYFMGYSPNRENSAYGGGFFDKSVQKETFFNVPDPSIYSSFWIEIDNEIYDATSGYIEMTSENAYKKRTESNYHKAHGTFDFVMENRYNKSDTIHVTNGKFLYQSYTYSECVEDVWN
ncbi:MAG: hypothetical protein LBS50_09880 [Prevotellaceae bacterium]|jgi:hypothetical protein|nr:hypothetical protein [Prevotellaceae bacterium]